MTELYPLILGEDFAKLHPGVAQFHGTGPGARAEGQLRVRRGTNLFSRCLGWLMGLPPEIDSIHVTLDVHDLPGGEHWHRSFDGRPVKSRMWEDKGLLIEAIGPSRFAFRLLADNGSLAFQTVGCRVLGLPLPSFLWPRVQAKASPSATQPNATDRFTIFVELAMPVIGLIVQYSGEMQQLESKQVEANRD